MARNHAVTHVHHSTDEWLTTAEVALITKLSPLTLANHRYLGVGIPYTKLTPGRSGRIRYRRSDVENWLAGGSVTAA